MPLLESEDLDHNGRPIKAPPTPPRETSSNSFDVDYFRVLDVPLTKTSNGSVTNGTISEAADEDATSKTISYHDPAIDNQSPRSPYLKADLADCNHVPFGGRHAIISGHELKMRRASSEVSVSWRDRDRSPSKRYSKDKQRDIPRGSDTTSIAVLSPVTSGHHDTEEALSGHRRPTHDHEIRRTSGVSSNISSHARVERPSDNKRPRNLTIDVGSTLPVPDGPTSLNRPLALRALSTPASIKSPTDSLPHESRKHRSTSRPDTVKARNVVIGSHVSPPPLPTTIPIPPLSLSTYLQLELSSQRPSPLYIYRPSTSEFPYESSRVKLERLLDFFLLPWHLEGTLWFGVLVCLDAWLYTFTILPLRMIKSIYILVKSWISNLFNEARFVAAFVYRGSQRVWKRRQTRSRVGLAPISRTSSENQTTVQVHQSKNRSSRHHRRTKSTPSGLLPNDKADILQGLLIICTCLILLKLDASRMYHWVRGQAAIKLYVIYNLLEVCDRLLSAIGQDVLECLFSKEALERKPDGRSKIWLPFVLFLFALAYITVHATALFYQVITLNVAVNSYSNALITLLMSNQFVEIKSTVFKKFEKENLFQLTCADVVERFQLWHMLVIIAGRNIVETGGFNAGNLLPSAATTTASSIPNITQAAPPLTAASILPRSFTILPTIISSLNSYVPTIGPVLGPFFIVLGSEMIIDSLKHAYINKFNNTKPVIYGRFLDILAKDYYTNAFAEQNLTKRLGLPVIPLSCLMIRTGFQTYQMWAASWQPSPSSGNSATLASIHSQYSATLSQPTSTAGMLVRRMDELLNQLPATISKSVLASHFTVVLWCVVIFLIALVSKLLLGMCILSYSRYRYKSMRDREHNPSYYLEGGRRAGGWGVVEVGEEKRRAIYEDDPAGAQALRNREAKEKISREKEREKGFGVEGLEKVNRYEMVAKRIW